MKNKYKCKNCGESVVKAPDGCWVHEDVDEDSNSFDYGWTKCLPKDGNGDEDFTYADPIKV